MQITTTNSLGETKIDEVTDLPEGVQTSGYLSYNEKELDSPETLETIEAMIKEDINKESIPKMNRSQRRALAKKAGKRGRDQLGTISETAKKLTYINLIQKLRELNEEKENENYEQATED